MSTSQLSTDISRKLVKEKQDSDPTLMTEEEFFEKLDQAEEEYLQGKYTTLLPGESVTDMLNRCAYGHYDDK